MTMTDPARRVLRLLYEFARNPFNDGTLLFRLPSICHATRLDVESAREVTRVLVSEGLADQPRPEEFRITLRGMQVAAHPRG